MYACAYILGNIGCHETFQNVLALVIPLYILLFNNPDLLFPSSFNSLYSVTTHSPFTSPICSFPSLEITMECFFTSFLNSLVPQFRHACLPIPNYCLQTTKSMRCWSFWVYIYSLSKMFSNSNNLLAEILFLTFFRAEWNFIMQLYYSFIIHSPVGRHLRSFHFLLLWINTSAITLYQQASWQ